eukprot:6750362-Karenia_brevis.AAC.1
MSKAWKPLKDFGKKNQHRFNDAICYACEESKKYNFAKFKKQLHEFPMRNKTNRSIVCEECQQPPCEACGAKINGATKR